MATNKKREVMMFDLGDFLAMEQYFEKMASEGWLVDYVGPLTVRFKKIQPVRLKFAVDIYFKVVNRNSDELDWIDLKRIYEEAGWSFAAKTNQFLIYYTENISTPSFQAESEKITESVKKQTLTNIAMLTLFIILGIFNFSPTHPSIIFNYTGIISLLFFLVFSVAILYGIIYKIVYYCKVNNNLKKMGNLPHTSLKSAHTKGCLLIFLLNFFIVAMFSAGIYDKIFSGSNDIWNILTFAVGWTIIYIFFDNLYPELQIKNENWATISSYAVCIIVSIMVFSALHFIDRADMNNVGSLPNGYNAISAADFSDFEAVQGTYFKKSTSFLVPVSYKYTEDLPSEDIETEYAQAANSYLAEYIFKDILNIPYWSTVPAPLWKGHADDAYYLSETRHIVVFIKGNIVVTLKAPFSLDNIETRDICLEKLGL